MNTIAPNQLIGQLNWRYATKQFDPQRKISSQEWASLEEALVLTPSSFGLQPWKFVVVTDPTIREKLVGVSWGQRQIADASHLVVFAIKKNLSEQDIDDHLGRISEVRGVPREALGQYREMMVGSLIKRLGDKERNAWSSNQVYIALGNFLTSAALLGIDACPMEGIEPPKYDEILGLNKQGLSTVVAAAAGYRAATDKYSLAKKVRFSPDQVLVRV
ncbi:MAG TPA: NAD(P)H-dependent oxidoreductase [Alphaproteobacteria bacterium]|nr:NAD(P)H-dependent oxidoreductase [Alphaproteobacteria bacterium]